MYKIISFQFQFFYEKNFKRTKMKIKPKPTKNNTGNNFLRKKTLRGGKLFVLHFHAFLRSKSFRKKE